MNTIESSYDTLAEEWSKAFANEHDNKPMDKENLLRFVLELNGRQPVWELGCGVGNTAHYLQNIGLKVSGLDISGEMLAQAKAAYPNINFQKGDMINLAFAANSIAGIVAFYSIVHFTQEQVRQAFREIYRVLQPKGILLLTFHIGEKNIHLDEFLGKKVDVDFMFFRSHFICDALRDVGFESIDTVEREPYIGIEYESRRAYVFGYKPSNK